MHPTIPTVLAALLLLLLSGDEPTCNADTRLNRSGYGIPFAAGEYRWGSNGRLLNRAIVLALAYDFTGAAFLDEPARRPLRARQ